MDTALMDRLEGFAADDWLPLWVIADEVADSLDSDDSDQVLEATLAVVKQLLGRGLLAGESPLRSTARFEAWPNQHPDHVLGYIRREWTARNGLPEWGDNPWFARCQRPASRAAA